MAERSFLDPGWPYSHQFGFNQGVRVGDLVLISGQMPVDETGSMVHEGDVTGQCKQVFENLKSVLAAGDLTMADVVEITTYHTDFRDMDAFIAVKSEYFTEDFPAWTSLGVTALAFPGQRVEVRATARVPG